MQVVKSLIRIGKNSFTILPTPPMGNAGKLWKGTCGKEGNSSGSLLRNNQNRSLKPSHMTVQCTIPEWSLMDFQVPQHEFAGLGVILLKEDRNH